MKEIVKGAKEFNLPVSRANRKLVASVNGGLHDPSVLVFNPDWDANETTHKSRRFSYPSVPSIKRPDNSEDIAFMTVSICSTSNFICFNLSLSFNICFWASIRFWN